MVQGEAILTLDLGNSSTKATVMFNKDKETGRYKERMFELSNVFAPIDEDYEISGDYNDTTSTVIKVSAEYGSMKVSGCYCNGELQRRERPLATIKPNARVKKWELESTLLSVRLAILQAYRELAKMCRVQDASQLDITWKIVTMLPPGDWDTGKTIISDIIKGVTEVDSIFPQAHYDVKISKVAVFPEGFGAYVGVVFDKGNVIRESYGYLRKETVMVFDIGAGTTDCLIIKDNAMVQNSKYTVDQGGINVHQLVRRSLMMEGIDIDDTDLRKGMVTGTIRDGAKDIDISGIINKAKEDVAVKIVSSFEDYLSLADIKMRSVGYLLACGGGSMQDGNNKIRPLSEKLLEAVKRFAPNAEIIELPKAKVREEKEDGGVSLVEKPLEGRMLNLIGASILAEIA